MKQTQRYDVLLLLPIITGVIFLMHGTDVLLSAGVTTGQGAVMTGTPDAEIVMEEDEMHAAADISAYGMRDFFIGIALVLLGFGFHTLLVLRKETSIPVHRWHKKQPDTAIEWWWMRLWP